MDAEIAQLSGLVSWAAALNFPFESATTMKLLRTNELKLAPDRATEMLKAKGVRVAEPTLLRRRDWAQLQGAELDSRVAEMVSAGKAIEAVELLRPRRGLGLAEAKRQVEELTAPR